MTATLARLPRRTTMRTGRVSTGTTAFPATSPSSLTAFSAILRLASAPLAASPTAPAAWTHESDTLLPAGRPGRHRRCGPLRDPRCSPSAGTCAPSFRPHGWQRFAVKAGSDRPRQALLHFHGMQRPAATSACRHPLPTASGRSERPSTSTSARPRCSSACRTSPPAAR